MKRIGRVVLALLLSVGILFSNIGGVQANKALDSDYETATLPIASTFCDGRPADSRTYCWRNCTSYVAYKLAAAGVSSDHYHYLGDAKNWIKRARTRGIASGTTPRVGAVAYWTSGGKGYGHVAWVEALNDDGSVYTTSYNGFTESYVEQEEAEPEGFIYFSNVSLPSARLITASKVVHKGTHLQAGQTLRRNQYLASSDRRYTLVLQSDSNLVLYGTGGRMLWHARTHGSGADRVAMQGDGNLVMYRGSQAVWHTRTWQRGRARAVVQNDGNLVLYTPANVPIWALGTR